MNITEFVALHRDRFHLLGGDLAGFVEFEDVSPDAEGVFPDELPPCLFQRERFVVLRLLKMRFSTTPPLLSFLKKPLVRSVDPLYDILQRLARERFKPKESACALEFREQHLEAVRRWVLLEKPIVPLDYRDEVIVNTTKLLDFTM